MSLILTSRNCTVDTTNSTMTLRLPRSIDFRGKEIALLNSQFYYSNPNITSRYNNNQIVVDYRQNSVDKVLTITFPDGFYSFSDIDAYIKLQFDNNGLYWLDNDGARIYPVTIQENAVYYSATISFIVFDVLPSGYTNPNNLNLGEGVYLTFNSNMGRILGFGAGQIPSKNSPNPTSVSLNSQFTPNITPVDAYVINLNLVNEIAFDTTYSNSVYILNSGNTAYGGLIYERPPALQWFNISDGTYSSIVLSIRDQTNENPVPLIDYSGTIFKFLIRDRQ
jgi:hypothetical protein